MLPGRNPDGAPICPACAGIVHSVFRCRRWTDGMSASIDYEPAESTTRARRLPSSTNPSTLMWPTVSVTVLVWLFHSWSYPPGRDCGRCNRGREPRPAWEPSASPWRQTRR